MPNKKKNKYSIGGGPENWTVCVNNEEIKINGFVKRFKRRSEASDVMHELRSADPASAHHDYKAGHNHVPNIAHRTQHKG